MDKREKWILQIAGYILVSAITACITMALYLPKQTYSKLTELENLIARCYIGETDKIQLEDAAAAAMVGATGDRWSYYIPASQFDAHMEQMNNSYVGIGVTISTVLTEQGVEILQVEPAGGAKDAGILPGDILSVVNGQLIAEDGVDKARELIRGEPGTTVEIGVIRDGKLLTFQVERKNIQVPVAQGQMLEGSIGLVTIANFDERCAEETIAAIETLVEQGATALIFDVRNNPGGYKKELVKVLDYLLPAGEVFRTVDYQGVEDITESDDACLQMPMAVVFNGNSYSAAEFFAAALEEYDWAITVGEPTVGKGYFQYTYQLEDGSAVGLSIGKYFTPKGVSLAEAGGLKPTVTQPVTEEVSARIYSGLVLPEEDPQIQAAIKALQ